MFIVTLASFWRRARGYSLVEVLVGLAIMSIFVTGLLAALDTGTKATAQSELINRALTEGRSQMEAINALSYVAAPTGGVADYSFVVPSNNLQVSTLNRSNNQISGHIYGIPWDTSADAVYAGSSPVDPGIQKVTIIIQSNGKEIYRLVDFKMNR
jgi:prepilin-type N-terminal cleavage/methylation domain-containing protein